MHAEGSTGRVPCPDRLDKTAGDLKGAPQSRRVPAPKGRHSGKHAQQPNPKLLQAELLTTEKAQQLFIRHFIPSREMLLPLDIATPPVSIAPERPHFRL